MRKHGQHLFSIGIAVWLGCLSGCSTSKTVSRIAPYSVARLTVEAGLSPADQKRVDNNCIFGLPKLDPKVNFGPTDFVARDGYVLVHSAVDKIPIFVCEHVTLEQVSGNLKRESNPFAPDPELKKGRRAELKDYVRSGYDRGHQAPAGDQTTDRQLKEETFYLSNMAPQKPPLNRKIWKELETEVRGWTASRKSIYIITGGMFYDPKEEHAATANGMVQHKVIGPDAVAVPTHFYKIVVAKDAQGEWQSIAFVLENKAYPKPAKSDHYHFEDFIKSVDWIQQRTGLNFMPDLDPVEEKRLEKTASPMWN